MIKEFMKIVETAEGITDAWFKNGSFETYKLNKPVPYTIADSDGITKTLDDVIGSTCCCGCRLCLRKKCKPSNAVQAVGLLADISERCAIRVAHVAANCVLASLAAARMSALAKDAINIEL